MMHKLWSGIRIYRFKLAKLSEDYAADFSVHLWIELGIGCSGNEALSLCIFCSVFGLDQAVGEYFYFLLVFGCFCACHFAGYDNLFCLCMVPILSDISEGKCLVC